MEGRALDGEINRALEGKKVVAVSKDGVFMTIHCDNGERWNVGWADFIAARGFSGEPVLLAIDDMKDLHSADTSDGSVDAVLRGQIIESARVNGDELHLNCAGGRRVWIGWAHNGVRVRAEPCLHKVDAVMTLEGVAVFGAETGNPNVSVLVGDHAYCGGSIFQRGAVIECDRCGWSNRG